MEKNNINQLKARIDLIHLFRCASSVGWKHIRKDSVHRIMYMVSVLFSFVDKQNKSPFIHYNFIVDSTGPFDTELSKAIDFLLKDDYIVRISGNDIFELGINTIEYEYDSSADKRRYEWLREVVYILAIYGENKIYEFIFRDPEYQQMIESNAERRLNIDFDNKTIKTLEKFRKAFEQSLKTPINTLSNEDYLKLYFEYIFSKILKREE